MAEWMGWLVAAGVLVILELFTGTFYLLMIAIGLAAAAIACPG
ncbi:NfeD family protein, partial [Massilia sp. CT11-108]